MHISIKLLSLSLLPLMLTACGGSDSDFSTLKPATQDYLFATDYIANERGEEFSIFKFRKDGNTIYSGDADERLDEILITPTRTYDAADRKIGVINMLSDRKWRDQVTDGIYSDIEVEWVNLSGKNVFDTLLPGYRKYVPYLNGQSGSEDYAQNYQIRRFLDQGGRETFPRGSGCYRAVTIQNNAPYFSIDPDQTAIRVNYSDYIKTLENETLLERALLPEFKTQVKAGNWKGARWAVIERTALADSEAGIIEYNQQFYNALYESDIKYDKKLAARVLEIGLDKAGEEFDPLETKLEIESLRHSCHLYNATAAEKLINIRAVSWR